MRLLSRTEISSQRRQEAEGEAVRSIRLSDTIRREKDALTAFRRLKDEEMAKLEAGLKDALSSFEAKSLELGNAINRLEEKKRTLMIPFERFRDELEGLRSVFEAERKTLDSDIKANAKYGENLKVRETEVSRREADCSIRETKLASDDVSAAVRKGEADALWKSLSERQATLDRQERTMLSTVDRDRKLLQTGLKELEIRKKLLAERKAELEREIKHLESQRQIVAEAWRVARTKGLL